MCVCVYVRVHIPNTVNAVPWKILGFTYYITYKIINGINYIYVHSHTWTCSCPPFPPDAHTCHTYRAYGRKSAPLLIPQWGSWWETGGTLKTGNNWGGTIYKAVVRKPIKCSAIGHSNHSRPLSLTVWRNKGTRNLLECRVRLYKEIHLSAIMTFNRGDTAYLWLSRKEVMVVID